MTERKSVEEDPEIFAVIMAGGQGERFWPLSRKNNPKQFLKFLDGSPLIEQTVLRLRGLVDNSHIMIITNEIYREKTCNVLPDLPPENIICEPCARNTAPCTALAAGIVKAKAKTENPVLLLLPADHYIENTAAMLADLKDSARTAIRCDALLTIGIPPTHPSPEYGYIECEPPLPGFQRIHNVKRFIEKPSVPEAEKLLAKGNFRWNAGMFIFPLRTLMKKLEQFAPKLFTLAETISEHFENEDFTSVLKDLYESAEKISIDYALMEKCSGIMLKDAGFVWEDVGNWCAAGNHLHKDENGNAVSGNAVLHECSNCIVYSDGGEQQLIAGLGLKDIILIRTGDAVLAASEHEIGKLKELLSTLRENGKHGGFL